MSLADFAISLKLDKIIHPFKNIVIMPNYTKDNTSFIDDRQERELTF